MLNKNLNKKNFALIKKLYWDEGYSQFDLGQKFGCDSGTISRIINDKFLPIEERLAAKKKVSSANWKAPMNEPQHIKNLRCNRDKLPSTKLNIDKAQSMRKEYFAGKKTQVELAAEHAVAQSTVCRIMSGKKWKTCKC